MKPVLVTIPISHYCEKARWALDRAGIAYDEEAHPPFFHMGATLGGGGRSTPQLRLEHRTLADSRDIVRWAEAQTPTGLLPADRALRSAIEAFEKRCDDSLGPAVRRYAYFHLLDRMPLLMPMFTRGVSAPERLALRLLSPLVPFAMRKALRIDPKSAARSRAKIDEVLDEVDAMLADGRPYLFGDAFSLADLTFAALGAPLVTPSEHPIRMPTEDEAPDALARDLAAVRARPAGQFILRLYARERARAA